MVDEARRALRVYMEQLSEDLWCAGWMTDLEFDLWTWVEHRRAGLGLPAEDWAFGPPKDWELDADTLAWLAEEAGGWWCWPDEGPGPVFVEMGEWRERYEGCKQSKEEAWGGGSPRRIASMADRAERWR